MTTALSYMDNIISLLTNCNLKIKFRM